MRRPVRRHSKRLVETDRAIVTEWRFAPGAETGWYRHAHDYLVVVLTAGKLMQETANGEIVTDMASGQSYARNAGVEHNVHDEEQINMGYMFFDSATCA